MFNGFHFYDLPDRCKNVPDVNVAPFWPTDADTTSLKPRYVPGDNAREVRRFLRAMGKRGGGAGKTPCPDDQYQGWQKLKANRVVTVDGNRFTLEGRLDTGKSEFASGNVVFAASCKEFPKRQYAVKLNLYDSDVLLLRELDFLSRGNIMNSQLFPTVLSYGYSKTLESCFFVMSMEGPNIEDVMRMQHEPFGISTALRLGFQMLQCVQAVHNKGFIVRNVQPAHFVIPPDFSERRAIRMVSFSMVSSSREQFRPKRLKQFNAIPFASLNDHRRKPMGQKDDLESWIYSIVYITKRALPWTRHFENATVHTMKESLRQNPADLERFFHGYPCNMELIFRQISDLKFHERVQYVQIFRVLQDALNRSTVDFNQTYDFEELPDWEEKAKMKAAEPYNPYSDGWDV